MPHSDTSLLIRQVTIIDPGSSFHNKVADILITNGSITDLSDAGSRQYDLPDAAIIDGSQHDKLYISAGWVDALADYREPGFEQKETIISGLNAAAAGGFTDVLLAPNTSPAISTKAAVQFALRQADGHAVILHPLGAASHDTEGKKLAEMLDMHSAGAIAFTDGWKPIQSSGLMQKALEYVKAFDGTIIQIPVDEALAKGGLMHEGVISTRLGMAGIPELAETLLVHRDIELARYTDSKLHITGITTAASVALIKAARESGVRVTCSVTPYHLLYNDECLQNYDSIYKVNPPLRPEPDRQALIAALADGTIDCIATHHRPQDWDAKTKEFEYAGEGMAVQESAFSMLWTAVKDSMPLEALIDRLTVRPRSIFGLATNSIEKGSKSGLTIFATGAYTLNDKKVQSLSRNNPAIGQALSGKVVAIINNHKTVMNHEA